LGSVGRACRFSGEQEHRELSITSASATSPSCIVPVWLPGLAGSPCWWPEGWGPFTLCELASALLSRALLSNPFLLSLISSLLCLLLTLFVVVVIVVVVYWLLGV